MGIMGSFCVVRSVSSGSAWYALFTLMWTQGVTPATLTAVGLARTTVHGPFQCGAKQPCFQCLTTPDPRAQIRESVPLGRKGTLSCTNLVTWFITLPIVPSAVKSHLPLLEANLLTPVLLWEGPSHTQFCTEKSHGTVGWSWVWAEPSETSLPGNSQSLRSAWRVSL